MREGGKEQSKVSGGNFTVAVPEEASTLLQETVLLYQKMMMIAVDSFSGLFVIQAVHSQYTEPESAALH